MTGLTSLSRLTQIAPPHTRFVFLGAGFRLGLPSHPASRRRSCLRLGVSITSSSRGLSPPSDRPCRAYSRRYRCAAPRRRFPRRLSLEGRSRGRAATADRMPQISQTHPSRRLACDISRLPRSRVSSSRSPCQWRPFRAVACDRATPTIDTVTTPKDSAPTRRTGDRAGIWRGS